MSNELSKKLFKEKFPGENPEWKKATWGDIQIYCIEDDENWYYKNWNSIYVQAKQGDHTAHCYGCGKEIEFVERKESRWKNDVTRPEGRGDVETKHIPYCPSCEKEPSKIGIAIV
jgi:hypothetical protein